MIPKSSLIHIFEMEMDKFMLVGELLSERRLFRCTKDEVPSGQSSKIRKLHL
jgi:hypothetical protein